MDRSFLNENLEFFADFKKAFKLQRRLFVLVSCGTGQFANKNVDVSQEEPCKFEVELKDPLGRSVWSSIGEQATMIPWPHVSPRMDNQLTCIKITM